MTRTIEARRVLGAEDYRDLADPEAVKELAEELKAEGVQTYETLEKLLTAERLDERRALGYEPPGRKVTRRELRQALQRQAGQ